MHLLIIAAFGLVLWGSDRPSEWRIVAEDDVAWTLLIAIGYVPLVLGLSFAACRRALKLLRDHPRAPKAAQTFYHRTTIALRAMAMGSFCGAILLTRWHAWLDLTATSPLLQILGDLIVLSPLMVALIGIWVFLYPLERAFRAGGLDELDGSHESASRVWSMGAYLAFNIRHHILVVAVPMTIILFASNLCDGYASKFGAWMRWPWAGDTALTCVACGVFVVAPIMLRYIWQTAPLEDGPMRERLEAVCSRIGLRCRQILVWKSDGMIINAAVMGMAPQVRYVLLSDGLLETMDARQVEAVFGHEAGHVRHHHLQHFLVFATVGWLVAVAIMELVARRWGSVDDVSGLSFVSIQGMGIVVTIAFWGIGFGWVSRRFERQADLFGARCVTPDAKDCSRPCSVHIDEHTTLPPDGRICATAAAVFVSALDRVATLNGIPHDERSWRHSSIGSRMRFLMALAGDPALAAAFDKLLARIKRSMLAAAVLLSAASVVYWLTLGTPVLVRMQFAVQK